MDKHTVIALAIFAAAYALLIWDKIDRAVVALLGAMILLTLGVMNQEAALHGIDFNTLGLLIGMMVIVGITQKTGVFQYLAIKCAKLAKGEPWRILVYLSILTAILSAILDNVTTVLLIAPIMLLITDELKISPYPFLFSLITASNIGGAATLIGDPPNIMIGSAVGLTFMDFLIYVAPLMPFIMIATFAVLYVIFGRKMRVDNALKQKIMSFREIEAIKNPKLLKKSLFVLGLTVTGFILHGVLHLEAATIALFGASLLMLITNADFHKTMETVEWPTIFFFAGLFVIVHGLVETGVIGLLANKLIAATQGDARTTAFYVLWGSAVLSAIVDNIPYVATMIPLIEQMTPYYAGGETAVRPIWWALSIGACIGGNGSIIGASANVIVAGFAARSGHPIGFVKFMALAFPLMLFGILISHAYIYLFLL
ncbi:MAG: ArsB/NhaD family transporter [Deltaproteobacteria bacterium]|nr:ArsB/NhaD family transporter [Deltaproteobacteria bacterium]